ncbi:hypothetical protein ACOMHN_012157 [Nucella lapillus]
MALPPGWKREEVVRQSGLSAGKTDVYYYSPDGKKIRSKPQLARLLGDTFDLSAFDFRTGRVIYSAVRKSKRQKGSPFDFARGVRVDSSLVLPIRQTASIFKQPVTVIRNHPESKTKGDLKHGVQEQPRQVFWEKRLQGLRACDSTEEAIQSMDLPRNMSVKLIADGDSKVELTADGDIKVKLTADGDSKVELIADGDSKVELIADGDSKVELIADGDSKVELIADGDSKVELIADGDSKVELIADGDSKVELIADGDSKVELIADGDSKVELTADGDSKVELMVIVKWS